MSRILFLTPQLPFPPHQGAAIRNLNLIKIAAQRHEVAICSFIRASSEVGAAGELAEWACQVRSTMAPRRSSVERLFWTAFSPQPDMRRRLHSDDFRRLMDAADIVQAEGVEMAQYLEGIDAVRVFDCHNAEWVLQQRTAQVDFERRRLVGAAYSGLQWLKLRRYERWACRISDGVVAVSDEDRRALLDLDPRLQIDVVPNGVDTTAFTPASSDTRPETVLFTGTLDFRPNIEAVRWLTGDIWPMVRRHKPDAELILAGRAPVRGIRRLDGQQGIRVVADPPDILPYFQQCAVYAVPVRAGGGSRYKLLQAMACGLATVSTTVGAEGIDVEPGRDVLLADDPAAFAGALIDLMEDRAERRRLGRAARELAQAKYDWSVIGPGLLNLYDRLLSEA